MPFYACVMCVCASVKITRANNIASGLGSLPIVMFHTHTHTPTLEIETRGYFYHLSRRQLYRVIENSRIHSMQVYIAINRQLKRFAVAPLVDVKFNLYVIKCFIF